MDGFISLFTDLVTQVGIPGDCIFRKKAVELPGFFRPTKEWDLLVVCGRTLVAVIEAKSQVGPSFGNNFNNRTEEAIGSALDLWTAYREKAYVDSPQPFLGYFFMLEDCEASNRPVGVQEPHFKVFPSLSGPHRCVDMNFSAGSLCWKGIIRHPPSSHHPALTVSEALTKHQQMICPWSDLQRSWLPMWQLLCEPCYQRSTG